MQAVDSLHAVVNARGSARFTVVLVWLLWSLSGVAVCAQDLPRPPGLEPDITFWRRIFTEIDAEHGLLHDNRYLGVVYDTLDLPPGAGTRELNRVYDKARNHYRQILLQLAKGNRKQLNREQARVLRLWPKGVSSAELRRAADRLRVQQGMADRFRAGFVRSGLWMAHIRSSLAEAGVPAALAALPHVESSFDPGVYSLVGASGLWQFTRATGKHYLTIDYVVDERRDPFISSEAAARLLRDNYDKLDSWPLAITAYNHGITGMRRAVRTLGTKDIEKIVRNYEGRSFGFASRNFYVAFLAAADIDANPSRYLGKLKREAPRQEMVVTLPHYVSVKALEKSFGIPAAVWREHNPALLDVVWQGAKHVPKGFGLRVPTAKLKAQQADFLAAIPASFRLQAQSPDRYHKVQAGDALSVIARRYDTTVSELVAWNSLNDKHRIRIGQMLRLPQSGQSP